MFNNNEIINQHMLRSEYPLNMVANKNTMLCCVYVLLNVNRVCTARSVRGSGAQCAWQRRAVCMAAARSVHGSGAQCAWQRRAVCMAAARSVLGSGAQCA